MSIGDNNLPRTIRVLEQGIAEGLHLGAQLYVSVAGAAVADLAIGEARPGEAMRADHLTLWMSSVKPVAAVAMAQLRERGSLEWDDPVARHIPEFSVSGKQGVTIRHVLTHTGGFRAIPGSWRREPWDKVIERICQMPLEPGWAPGQKAGYHVASGWFVLGEIIRRLDGRTYDRYTREMIFLPLKMNDSWVGIPLNESAAYGPRIAPLFTTAKGARRIGTDEPTPESVAAVHPHSNGRGPICELGRFYQMLLNGGSLGGKKILSPKSVAELTSPQRVDMYDHTFKHVIDLGLGFILNSNRHGTDTVPYGYGRHASPRAFGHSGNESSCAFADPEHNLAVAWVCNAMTGDAAHQERQRAINTAIYQDLGLGLLGENPPA